MSKPMSDEHLAWVQDQVWADSTPGWKTAMIQDMLAEINRLRAARPRMAPLMSDYTSVPMRNMSEMSSARVHAARNYAFTVTTDIGHEWTDADIAALTAPGKFLPGLADLMSRKPVWAEDEA